MVTNRTSGQVFGAVCAVLLVAGGVTDSPIADAAMRGDAAAVRELIAAGADVNAPHGDGMTALHWAAERDNTEIVTLVVEAGATLDPTTRNGAYTPLHLASKIGGDAVISLLLDAGADPTAVTTTGGATALHFAAASGSVPSVAALLDHGAPIDATESEWAQTPLMFAAAAGQTGAAALLLERGADPSITSAVVDLPARQQADRAASQRRNEVLATFLGDAGREEGKGPTPAQVRAAVRAAQQQPAPAEHAAEEDSVDTEEAQPGPLSYADLVGRHGGMTALLHAVREGHAATAFALIDGGANINQVGAGDRTSPLVSAMINGHFDLGLALLERGADPRLASDAGTTPLYAALNTHWAPKARYPQQEAYKQQDATYLEVMEALLDAGADPNARLTKHLWYMSYTFDLLRIDTKGATPFWRAAYATDVEAMRLLVARGADHTLATIKAPQRRFRRGPARSGPDPSGLPPVPVGGPAAYPIHAASGIGYGEGYAGNAHRHVPDGWIPAVRYLVEELGADVNARDHNGYTPLHHAAARGDNELIHYLVERGADVTVVSRRGQTTVDMANGPVQRIQPFPETIALLESLGAVNNHNCLSCE